MIRRFVTYMATKRALLSALDRESGASFLAEHRRELFPDEMFADLFPTRRGRPSVPADVMAAMITLQSLHACQRAKPSAVTFDLR